MSEIHSGTSVTLATILNAANSDIAYIWHGSYKRKMVFDSTSTDATDTTNHPYKVRPSNYVNPGTLGVWIEDMGADQPQVWNANQVKGISGTSLEILDGGDIIVNAGGDIILEGADSDPGVVQFSGSSYNVNIGSNADGTVFEIAPATDDAIAFTIGGVVGGPFGANKYFSAVNLFSKGSAGIWSYPGTNSAGLGVTAADGTQDYGRCNLTINNGAGSRTVYFEQVTTGDPQVRPFPANTVNLGVSSSRWENAYMRFLDISTSTTLGKEALLIDQNDEDEPFIKFEGTAEAGSSKNLSTWTTGNSIQGFIRVNVGGTDYWMPVYDAPTS